LENKLLIQDIEV